VRAIPEPLYQQVLGIALAITNATEAGDAPARRGAYRRLRSLYRSRLGSPDPFLTETLADFTGGPRTRIKLYRLAIQQCTLFPDEDVSFKENALAEVLAKIKRRPQKSANDEEFIAAAINALEESVSFFSNAGRQERERWVVVEFLSNLGLQPNESTVVSPSEDPPDVLYADARFEVKEIMDPGRLRHAEYKESLRKAKKAKVASDLLEEGTPREITYSEVCALITQRIAKIRPYAPATQSKLDLLFYVNLENVRGYVSDELAAVIKLPNHGWRSVSFVAGPMGVVLYASASAPAFLRNNEGKVIRHQARTGSG
jgi:hypothetical protein